jgi:thymidylate synthase (FAD)
MTTDSVIVKLMEHTHLSSAVIAGRTCWQSFHRGGNYDHPTDDITAEDRVYLDRIINKHKHGSVSEHIVYVFQIQGIPRMVLQELARHRIASLSVKSSRYTLKELKKAETNEDFGKFIWRDSNEMINTLNIERLKNIKTMLRSKSADDVKGLLPEAYLTDMIWTINSRSLKNFLSLRIDNGVFPPMRELAEKIFEAIPETHKFIYEGESEK